MRTPRGLVWALGTTTALSAGALTWFAWEILQQERTVEVQRARDWLGNRADQVAQSIDRVLSDAADVLASPEVTSRPGWLSDDGLVLILSQSSVDAVPSSKLRFYPIMPARPVPPATVFTEAESLEFRQRDRTRAIDAYRAMARTRDPGIRAEALMRLGGVLRQARQYDAARACYIEMAALGDVPMRELPPADLVARDALWRVDMERSQAETARETARRLYLDLTAGRWKLTQGQYEFYAGASARAGTVDQAADHAAVAVAKAAAVVWDTWRSSSPPRGRKVVRIDSMPLLIVWQASAERLAAWIVEPARILARANPSADVRVALAEIDGTPVVGVVDRSSAALIRTAAETRLPWELLVSHASTPETTSFLSRRGLVAGGLLIMLTFLGASAYFIARAVRQEMELARLQAAFVAAVSHEFRTPLAAMRQVSELLAAGRVPTESRRQQNYESLAAESQRLQRLVENLLDFGKLEAGARPFRLEPIDPRALVERVVDDFRSQMARPNRGSCIDAAGEPGSRWILGDAEALSLALRNLLDNAVKYSRGEGTVRVSWAADGDRIALRVSDDGPGVAPDEQSRIFQKFVRGSAAVAANVKGVGLGLAMVHQIVAGHGGEITVSTAPGAGATFTMHLPALNQRGSDS